MEDPYSTQAESRGKTMRGWDAGSNDALIKSWSRDNRGFAVLARERLVNKSISMAEKGEDFFWLAYAARAVLTACRGDRVLEAALEEGNIVSLNRQLTERFGREVLALGRMIKIWYEVEKDKEKMKVRTEEETVRAVEGITDKDEMVRLRDDAINRRATIDEYRKNRSYRSNSGDKGKERIVWG